MGRSLSWDWYPGEIPDNVDVDESAYVETTFSFHLFRSRREHAVRIGKGASTYLGTMFDTGPEASITIGDYALVHGARIICDAEIEVGDYALISWNVVIMDSYRAPLDRHVRRLALEKFAQSRSSDLTPSASARPVRLERNVWIGFDSCILPGVTIGEGAVVGARSVVNDDVPPYTVVAGNPAKVIRRVRESND